MEPQAELLARLNRLSLTRSFTPQVDIDWASATTEAEYAALYPAWGLFVGTGLDARLDDARRATYVKYQQINLMLLTACLERYAVGVLAELFQRERSEPLAEYVGHFMKEEIYHDMMFRRAIGLIQASMPGSPPLPGASMERTLRRLFGLIRSTPGRRLRTVWVFSLLRFVERVTLFTHQTVQSRIPRRAGLINQVWAFHARDEARHVAFDTLVLERNRGGGPLGWLPRALAISSGVALSLRLNANELWIGRQVGIRVPRARLPWLMRRTQAPFKRRIIGMLASLGEGGWEAEKADRAEDEP